MAENPKKRYQDDEGNWVDPNTVQGEFSEIGLSAKAFNPNKKRGGATHEELNERVESEALYMAEMEAEQIHILQERSLTQQALLKERAALKQAKLGAVRGISTFARWTGIGIAVTAYFWQFLAASASLIGMGIWGSREYIVNETVVGKTVSTVAGWVGLDFQKLFPAEYIAFGFWGLATLIALFTFIAFMLWFYLTGVRVFRSTISTLLTSLCFALSILPVSNLFPWIALWIVYINLMETASLVGGIKGTANTSSPLKNLQQGNTFTPIQQSGSFGVPNTRSRTSFSYRPSVTSQRGESPTSYIDSKERVPIKGNLQQSEISEASPTSPTLTREPVAPQELSVPRNHEVRAPQFVKEFSREKSQEERNVLAGGIRERRRQRDDIRVEQGVLGGEKEKLEQDLKKLATTIEGYNDASFLGKIKDYFEYKKTKVEGAEKKAVLSAVTTVISDKEEEIPQFIETKKMIDDFYNGEKKKWAEAGYTPEDISKQFTEDNLSKLSIDEYALLMKRFPGEMITHVTRQGIRDHAGMREHTAGLGKFHNNFTDILTDGRIRSSIGIALQEHTKEDAVVKFLKLDHLDELLPGDTKTTPREKALLMHGSNFEHSMSSSFATYADKSSVHTAAEVVLDGIYGGERKNEIFIAYPSAYVASQFQHTGKLTDGDHDKHNDTWIYTKDHEGMPLDAGLVFIPEDARVDPKTGSRYEISADNSPIKNEAAYKGLEQIAVSHEFEAIYQQIMGLSPEQLELLSTSPPSTWDNKLKEIQESSYKPEGREELYKRIIPIRDKVKKITRIDDDRILAKLLGYTDLKSLHYANLKQEEWARVGERNFVIEAIVEKSGAGFVEAKNTISSKNYWEKYFQEHPEQRPSKIIYYKGGDPSDALNEWRRKSGIVKRTNDPTYGFSENRIDNRDVSLYQDRDRFSSLALKIIDDRFPEHTEHNNLRGDEKSSV